MSPFSVNLLTSRTVESGEKEKETEKTKDTHTERGEKKAFFLKVILVVVSQLT